MERVLLIDGMNLFWRCYESAKKSDLHTSEGRKTFATFTMIRSIWKHYSQVGATRVAVAWDIQGSSQSRKEVDPNYKSDRVANYPDDFIYQLEDIKRIIAFAKGCNLASSVREADDILICLARSLNQSEDIEFVRIVSQDHDIIQGVSEKVELIREIKGKDPEVWNRGRVLKEFGIEPERLAEFWALIGDPGDCVPTLLGRMEALELLKTNTVFDLIKSDFRELGEKIDRNYQLVSPWEWSFSWEWPSFDWNGARPVFEELGFASLLKKLNDPTH